MRLRLYWLAFLIITSSLIFMTINLHSSYAVPPSACNNRIDARIVSIKISSEGTTYDVFSKRGVSFDASIDKGYSIKILLAGQSMASSSGRHSFWITTTAYGFSSGMCVSNPHVSMKDIKMGQVVDGLVQTVKWGSWPDTEQVVYKVRWH